MSTHLLFVYGTLLQPGNEFAGYMSEQCSFVSTGKIKGKLYDTGEYPGLIINQTVGYVFGLIYEINSDLIFKAIDAYEGVGPEEEQPNLYLRQLHLVKTDNGFVNAWVYVYNLAVKGFTLIESGDYLQYIRQKKSPDS